MLEQQCRNCGSDYDYFDKTATVICENNHVICRICAISLRQTSGLCPYCYVPMLGTQNQQFRQQPQVFNNPPYWQANSGQGFQNNPQIHPIPGNQGFLPNPPFQRQKSGIFCGLSIIFLMVFIVLLVIVISMDNFDSAMPGFMFGLFFSFFLCVSFFMRFIAARRRNRMIRRLAIAGPQANYVRI